MKSKGKKAKLNKLQEVEVSEEDLKLNMAETRKMKLFFLEIPLGITIILALIYIFTLKWFLLIFIAITFFISLFGIEGNSNTCPECHKWGKVIWDEKNERKIRTVKHTITKKDGTELTKEKKEKVDRRKGNCLNCGKKVQKEKIKHIK